eukprot:scaffold291390_cov14-Tisochrysis_lutea.AAC.1
MNPSSIEQLLPPHISKVVMSMARPLGVPPAMLPLPLLSVSSSVLGCSLRVAPHPNMTEALQTGLWTCICAPPGTGE